MDMPVIFRKRFIPDEIIQLKDDILLYHDEHMLITKWCTLKPRCDIAGGVSLYLPEKNWKISRIVDSEGSFLHYYCDIIKTDYSSDRNEYIFTDLLADVVVSKDNCCHVLDLDELADALENKLIDQELICTALKATNALINAVENGEFKEFTDILKNYI